MTCLVFFYFSSPEVDQPESTPEENVAVEIDKDERIAILETELKNEKQKCAALQIQLKMERFGVTRFSRDNKLIFLQ